MKTWWNSETSVNMAIILKEAFCSFGSWWKTLDAIWTKMVWSKHVFVLRTQPLSNSTMVYLVNMVIIIANWRFCLWTSSTSSIAHRVLVPGPIFHGPSLPRMADLNGGSKRDGMINNQWLTTRINHIVHGYSQKTHWPWKPYQMWKNTITMIIGYYWPY